MSAGVMKVRGNRLDRDQYDPPARDLVGARDVADELGFGIHSILQAIRKERLWAINLGTDTRSSWFTTWRAVADWTTGGYFRGPYSSEDQP